VHDNENLPVHERTGLRAVGIVGGKPVWPILGGSGPIPGGGQAPPAPAPTPPPNPAPPTGQPASAPGTATPPTPAAGPAKGGATPPASGEPKDEPLGEGGKKALEAEREARKALEKQVAALAPLQKLAEALGVTPEAGQGKTEIEQITERLANHEQELASEREARWRAEVANEKQLTPEQAAELRGATREELAAHADRLLTLFPQTQQSGTPRPDPSQGGRGGGAVNLDTQIQEAQKKGDYRAVIALQNQKLANAGK
jgi:hypothetical protein